MKRIYAYFSGLLILASAFTACSPEEFTHPTQGGQPSASNIEMDVTVDQETRQVTFRMKEMKGCIPYWIYDSGKEDANKQQIKAYSTRFNFTKIYTKKGTYTVEAKLLNANGLSDGSVTTTFTIENSLVNFDSYIQRLTDGTSKVWRIANKEVGHLGCGESGTEGLGWYAAQADEKAAFGLYDDRLTFGANMSYTYNPGEGGTMYVNKDCTLFPEYAPGLSEDYMAKVAETTTTYSFDVVGDDLYLVFPPKTPFPYIPNNATYEESRYRVVGLSPSKMELVADNGSIAWHYILVSGEEQPQKPAGYDPDHACNMWKNAKFTNETFYAQGSGWTPVEGLEVSVSGNVYTISLPEPTHQQWQAQVKFLTDLTSNAHTNYDFSAMFTSNKEHKNVTVKLVKNGDDGVYYFAETIALKAHEDYVFIKTDMPGIDMENVNLVLDFGGNEAETEVVVSRVVLKEHGCNDGTVIEAPEEEEDNVNWNAESDCNLWKKAQITNSFFYADAGWQEYPEKPGFEAKNRVYTITLPSPTVQQWQAQVKFHTDIATNAATKYDFRCILNATKDINRVTVKLVKEGDDGTFFFTENVDLKAFQDYVFKAPAMEGIDMEAVTLVLDFGGNPADTEITVSSVILKESECNS